MYMYEVLYSTNLFSVPPLAPQNWSLHFQLWPLYQCQSCCIAPEGRRGGGGETGGRGGKGDGREGGRWEGRGEGGDGGEKVERLGLNQSI